MRSITMKSLCITLLATAITMFSAPAASAQAPPTPPTPPTVQEVLQQCAQSTGNIAQNAVQMIAAKTQFTLAKIAELDANGAPPMVIFNTGKNGVEVVNQKAHTARTLINQVAQNCAQVLQAIEAPPAAFEALNQIRKSRIEFVAQARANSVQTIKQAVRDAIQDEDGN